MLSRLPLSSFGRGAQSLGVSSEDYINSVPKREPQLLPAQERSQPGYRTGPLAHSQGTEHPSRLPCRVAMTRGRWPGGRAFMQLQISIGGLTYQDGVLCLGM